MTKSMLTTIDTVLARWSRAQILALALCGVLLIGLIDYLHPDGLSPEALTIWMQADISRLTRQRQSVDLNGLERINKLFGDLIDRPVCSSSSFVPKEKLPHVL